MGDMVSTTKIGAANDGRLLDPADVVADAPGIGSVPQSRRTAVLVVAMHRSGTSALSRTLNLLGCDASPNPMPADEYNASGYWESRPIYELNEKILSSGGAGWAEWMEFNPNWFRSSAMDRYRERAEACIEAEFGKSNLFVIKDPRLSLLMPFWRAVFDSMGIEPVVIHTLRNPIEVARSLERRNKFLISKGILLWLRYTLEGERGTRGLRRFFTTYDDLMDDHVGFIERSQESLGLYWPRNSDKLRRELNGFLENGLRHHKESSKGLRSLSYAAKWVETTYETLQHFAAHGESDAGRAMLDAVHAEFAAAGQALGSIVKENDERFTHIGQLKQESEDSNARKVELEQAVAQATSLQAAMKAEQAAIEAKAAEALQRSNALGKEKAALEEQHRAVQQERETFRQKVQALENAIAQSRQQRDEMKVAQGEIEARAVAAQEHADAIQRAKTALEQRHLATQKERDGLRELRVQLEAEQASASKEREALVERADAIQRAKTTLEERHLATQKELDGLRELRVQFEAERVGSTKERDALQDRVRQLEESLAKALKDQDTLKAAQAELQEKVRAAQERADTVQQAKTALEGRHLATQKERDELRELRIRLEAEQTAAAEERARLLADKQALEAAVEDAGRTQEALNRALAEGAAAQSTLMQDKADLEVARTEEKAQLQSALETRDRELASLTMVLADTERTAGDHQVKAVQTEQMAQQWEAEAQRLSGELQEMREAGEAELSTLRHTLAQTESALRQRQLESEQVGEELIAVHRQARAEREAFETARSVLDQKLEAERFRASSMERGRLAAEEEIQRRFDEIASVTERLIARDAELADARDEMVGIAEQLSAQEAELAGAREGMETLAAVLAVRDVELAGALDELGGVAEQLTGRDAELAGARDWIDSITAVLAARDVQIANLNGALADVRHVADQQAQEVGRLAHEVDAAEARIREHQAQSGDSERRFVDTLHDFTIAMQDKNARIAQLEEKHDVALRWVETARGDAQQQKEMLRAMAMASREDVEARRNDARDTRQAGEQIYQQFLMTLQAMLAQAVLPFPALTRRKTIERQRRILEDHAGFDPAWYIAAHDDLRDSGVDPYRHYIRHGVAEGRAPNAAMEALRARMSSAPN